MTYCFRLSVYCQILYLYLGRMPKSEDFRTPDGSIVATN